MSVATERKPTMAEREAQRMRQKRAASRDLTLPPCLNPKRRAACEQDIYLALQTYFPHRFSQEFTPSRREMVEAIFGAMRDGTAQALAAPRGDGKTTIAECVVILCVLYGWVRFPLILAQTAEYAGDRLEGIKREIETNDRLAEDFPEVCLPARDVSTAPQRCASQTVNGELTHMRWSGDTIILPTVPGSKCAGSVIRARGITGSLRGMNVNGRRPDLVIIDDPDDEESADSETKTARRVKKINQSIDGLAQDGEPLGQVMLCTLINRTCVAYQYTDREQNPAWNGKRFRAIETMPDRVDLWEEYIRLRQEDQQGGDKFARRSHQFVVDRMDEMHAGSVVGNPLAFDSTRLEDGTQREASRLQHCYNIIAKIGWNSFRTEYQNDPPEDDGPQDSGITEAIVAGTDPGYVGRVNGRERLVAPAGVLNVTGHIDVHKRHLEWTLIAWSAGARGSIVDYGRTATHQPDVVGEEEAIFGALRELRDMFQTEPVRTPDGDAVPMPVCLVDCGYQPEAVYRFCRESGEPYHPAMGDSRFKRPAKPTADKRPGGDWWYWSQVQSEAVGRIWVVNQNPDEWKHSLHETFLTLPRDESGEQPEGTLTLWGETARDHLPYAEQVCAEIWTTEFKEGKGERQYWRKRRHDNHWLDTTVGCLVGAAVANGPGLVRKSVRLSELRGARA